MNVIDIVFTKRMSRVGQMWTTLAIDRVSLEDGKMLTIQDYVGIMSTFITKHQLVEEMFAKDLPEQVIHSLKELIKTDNIVPVIEKYLAVLRFFNYNLMVIYRNDLTQEVDIGNEDTVMRTYLLEHTSSDLGMSNLYSGWSTIFPEQVSAAECVFDAFMKLGMSVDDINLFNVSKDINYFHQLAKVDASQWDSSNIEGVFEAKAMILQILM